MSTLVIVEHAKNCLKPATLHAITAAHQLGETVKLLIVGKHCQPVAEQAARIANIDQVFYADAETLVENQATFVANWIQENHPKNVLASSTTFGKNIIPRIAALLDVAAISDVTGIISPDIFVRPIYAGNAIATIQSLDAIKLLTVRTTAFAPALFSETAAPIISLPIAPITSKSHFIKYDETISARPELTSARIIVAGGRGMQNGENFKLLETLADRLGAAIGASRAAVDAGFVPNDYQVGQTGKVVAPDLYIAIGISGAIQHVAGMKDSKVIIAINKDPDAPIFKIADYGIVGDLFEIVPQLITALEKRLRK